MLDGIVIVDKPAGWTSHDVVAKMRGIAGTRRVGHLGTLDPIATGVLPVMIGQATRLAQFFDKSEKAYEAVVRLGFATSTYDREGQPAGPVTEPSISAEAIEACLAPMRGEIDQLPPPVSAKKIKGVPAYKLARQNLPVELAPVRVRVHELTLREIARNGASAVGALFGGNIRPYDRARSGRGLGCGAHVESLRRTARGHSVSKRREASTNWRHGPRWQFEGRDFARRRSAARVSGGICGRPYLRTDRQGRDFTASPFRASSKQEHVKAIGPDGRLVAIGEIVLPHVYHPIAVFA